MFQTHRVMWLMEITAAGVNNTFHASWFSGKLYFICGLSRGLSKPPMHSFPWSLACWSFFVLVGIAAITQQRSLSHRRVTASKRPRRKTVTWFPPPSLSLSPSHPLSQLPCLVSCLRPSPARHRDTITSHCVISSCVFWVFVVFFFFFPHIIRQLGCTRAQTRRAPLFILAVKNRYKEALCAQGSFTQTLHNKVHITEWWKKRKMSHFRAITYRMPALWIHLACIPVWSGGNVDLVQIWAGGEDPSRYQKCL